MPLLKNLYFDVSGITSVFASLSPAKKSKVPAANSVVFNKDLPSVAAGLKAETIKADEKIEQAKIPSELPKVATRYQKELPKIDKPIVPPSIKRKAEPEIPGNGEHSFFSTLLAHAEREQKLIHDNSSKDVVFKNLFSEMKSFWEEKKQQFDQDVIELKIKDELKEKMSELRNLELEWQSLQVRYDKTKEDLEEKERLIESSIAELKRVYVKTHFEQDVDPDKAFQLRGGIVLNNLADLRGALLDMHPEVFNFHVNENKNDFANWVRDVMGLDGLAEQFAKSRTKEDHLAFVDTFYSS